MEWAQDRTAALREACFDPIDAETGFGPTNLRYTAHGTLSATLVKQDGSNETATVSLAF
jgi:hypothetical protein